MAKDPITQMLKDINKWSKDMSQPLPPSVKEANKNEEDLDPEVLAYYNANPLPDFGDIDELTPEQEAELDAWYAGHLNFAQQVFIDQVVRHGNRRIAYQKAYPGTNDRSARTGAWRLMSKPEIANAIRKRLLDVRKQELALLKEEYGNRLADIEEKRAILANIIRGELVTQRETTKNGETQVVKYTCDPKERLKAILVDNKLEAEWLKLIALPDEGGKLLERA